MKVFTYIIMLLVLVLGVSFAILNATPVPFNYYVGKNELPLSLLLVITLAFGGFLGLAAGLVMHLKMKRENFRLGRKIKLVEKELTNIRKIPLKDSP